LTASLPLPLVFEEVRDRLRHRVVESAKPGDRLPPIPELARQLGTGQVNMGRAVRALVREGVLVSRPRRGTFVAGATSASSAPPASASSASALVSATVALLRSNSIEPFMDAAIKAAGDELRQARAVVSEQRYRGGYIAQTMAAVAQADAVVVFNPPSNDLIQPRPGQALVLVRTGSELPVVARVGADLVTVDSEQGGYLAGEWMRRCGVRDVCFLGRHKAADAASYDMTSMLRLTGFEQGWGAAVDVCNQLKAPFYKPDSGGLAMAKYVQLSPRPQGVFCASDDLAVGFACAGLSHGLVPGQDFHLVGFDGQIRGRELMYGPLTTVEVPVEAMGRAAVKVLAQRMSQPQEPARRISLSCGFLQGATAPLQSEGASYPASPPSISDSLE